MKLRLRMWTILLVVVMLGGSLLSARAQASIPCFGLAEADCALLQSAVSGPSAAKYTAGMQIAYALNTTFAGETPGTMSVSGEAALGSTGTKPVMSATINLVSDQGGQQTNDKYEVRLVNNRFYFNNETLTKGGWNYVDSEDAKNMMSSLQGLILSQFGDFGNNAVQVGGEALGGSAGALTGDATVPGSVSSADLGKIRAALLSEGVITATAQDGPAANPDTRQFTFTVNIAKLVALPEFRPAVEQFARQQAAGAEVTEADINKVSEALTSAAQGITITANLMVGKTDRLLHHVDAQIGMKLDEAAATTLNADQPVDAKINLVIDMSQIGTAPSVQEPTDATKFSGFGDFGSGTSEMTATPEQ